MRYLPLLFVALVTSAGCKRKHEPTPRPALAGSGSGSGSGSSSAGSAAPPTATTLSRDDFNRFAVRLNLPIFWIQDSDHDGKPSPAEIAPLLFYPTTGVELDKAIAQIADAAAAPPLDTSSADGKRRDLVRKDLDAGYSTLIYSDLSGLAPEEKTFVQKMLEVAAEIDDLFELTNGATALRPQLPPDIESQSLFRRNRGPECKGAATAKEPACSAIPGAPPVIYDLYPAELQKSGTFCKDLEKAPNAKALLGHFNVVRGNAGKLEAVPYHVAYNDKVTAISKTLLETAKGIKDPNEKALVTYLEAAAKSFLTDDWRPADEAWAAMTVDNSKWYVRIAPDEVYWEPCAAKAAFHITFARIDQASRDWQKKLAPLQQDMEAAVAAKAGPPYKQRKVTFHLPDFIQIVFNAGEDREALSTVAGQSLPNWGPLVEAGRGRTWAATNIGTDPDTIRTRTQQASSLLDTATTALYPGEFQGAPLNVILHEATHNLGPAHDYKVNGKTPPEFFGGTIASMFEELKAETGALFFLEMLRSKNLISDEIAKQYYVYAVTWCFGQISQGMYTATKSPKAYGQLAAIQIGYLIDKGALTWSADAMAANGTDKGAFTMHFDKMASVSDEMMKDIAGIYARGDRAAAEQLLARYVDSTAVVPLDVIMERYLRQPRSSHVYSVRL